MSNTRNPLIGLIPADTMNNCAQVLEIIQLATESADPGDDSDMGFYLVIKCVKHALYFESHNHNKRKESTYTDDNIAQIERESAAD